MALLRLEQLAPFPEEVLEAELRRYSPEAQLVWCQEEPRNMGAWFFVAPRIENLMEAVGIEQRRLIYAGRKPLGLAGHGLARASTSASSTSWSRTR